MSLRGNRRKLIQLTGKCNVEYWLCVDRLREAKQDFIDALCSAALAWLLAVSIYLTFVLALARG